MLAVDGLPLPQRYWAILTMAVALTMAVLDGVIANVALPSIAKDLGTGAAGSIWVVNSYQLAVTVSLFPLASLGDIVGYRRVYAWGLAVFTVGSLACALSDTLPLLTAARVVQGFGAAGIMSVNIALVRFIYPQSQLGRGVGFNAMVVAVASVAGPPIAGAILSVATWQWLFAINVPLGVLALGIATRTLPQSPRAPHKFDIASALLNALVFGLLITGIKGLDGTQPAPVVAAELVAMAVLGVVLVRRQLAQTAPLLPVDLLRMPVFALSVATSIGSFAGQSIAYVAMPFYLQDVVGLTEAQTGFLMTPWPLAVAVMAPLSGRLADRVDPSLLSGLGLLILSVGLAVLALMPVDATAAGIAWRMALCGVGFGLFQTPNNKVLVTSAPKERSGGASGIQSTARLLGQTLGAAFVGLLFSAHAVHGTGVALALAAALSAAGCVSSSLRARKVRSADVSAAE